MKAKISTFALVIMALMWFSTHTKAQIIANAPAVTACPGSSVSVPITVSNFSSVASISLTLNVNPAVMTFTSYTANSALSGGFTVVNSPAPGAQVIAAWFGLGAVTLPANAVLFTFNFTYLGGSAPLTFDIVSNGACLFSDLNGDPIPTEWNNGSMGPSSPTPVFNSQPASVTLNAGANGSFTTDVANASSLLWQESTNGSTWNDLADQGIYSGCTTNTLQLTGVTLGMNGYQYRCKAHETGCNQTTFSAPATLTVNSVTNDIIAQLGAVTACPGAAVVVPITVSSCNNIGSFHLVINFPATLSFTGISNQSSVLGGNASASLVGNSAIISWNSASAVSVPDGLLLDLNFTDAGGNGNITFDGANSWFKDPNSFILSSNLLNGSIADLSVAPSFSQHPANQSIAANSNTTFSVTASGASSYQWEISTNAGGTWSVLANGGNYNGVTTSTLQLTNVPLTFTNNWYRCTAVEGSCGLASHSNHASLTVNPSTTDIVTTLGNVTTCPGGLVTIPVNVTNFTGVASGNFKFNYDTLSLTYDTTINVNPDLASGLFVANAAGGQYGMAWFSIIPSTFGNGLLFDIVFHYDANNTALNFDLSPGTCSYTDINFVDLPAQWVNGFVTLPGPVIANMPSDQVALVGSNATFTLTGSNIDSYQWQKLNGATWTDLSNNTIYNGVTTNSLTVNNVNLLMDGNMFRCIVTGSCGTQYSYTVELMVINAIPVVITLPTVTHCQGPITIPISFTGFNNIGSFSLTFNTTGNTLLYNGYQNLNPALSNMVITHTANTVTMTFISGTPVSVPDGTMIEFKYNTNAGSTGLAWDMTAGVNYFKSVNGTTLPATFTSGTVTVNAYPGPPAPIQGPGSVCQGVVSSTFSTNGAANALSYVWDIIPSIAGTISGTGLNATVTWDPTFTGLATITCKGSNSCGFGAIMSKAITVVLVPVVTFDPIPNTCSNDTVILWTGQPSGGVYTGTGVVSGVFYPAISGPGTFTITYTFTNNGCSASATQTVTVYNSPVVTFDIPAANNPVCYNYPAFSLSGGFPIGGTYTGTGVTPSTGIFTPSLAIIGDWTLTYTYTSLEGCTATATDLIHVDACPGFADENTSLSVEILPNPNTGLFNIRIENLSEISSIGLYNDLGQKIFEEQVMPQSIKFTKEVDLSNQPKGLYFLKISGAERESIEKIVVN